MHEVGRGSSKAQDSDLAAAPVYGGGFHPIGLAREDSSVSDSVSQASGVSKMSKRSKKGKKIKRKKTKRSEVDEEQSVRDSLQSEEAAAADADQNSVSQAPATIIEERAEEEEDDHSTVLVQKTK